MARKLTKNNAHFQRAVKRLPLGVASNFRYWGEERTIYVKTWPRRPHHRSGRQRLRRLPDGLRSGHSRLRAPRGRRGGASRHGESAAYSPCRLNANCTVAERISKMVPAAELVRFSNSGTEAVMAGLRLARAYTGKDDYVILEGSYHGLFDAAMWFTPMDKWSQVGDPEVKPYSEGVPISIAQLSRTSCRPTMPISWKMCSSAMAIAHCVHADRTHHGQLPRHCRRSRVLARGALRSATSTAW